MAVVTVVTVCSGGVHAFPLLSVCKYYIYTCLLYTSRCVEETDLHVGGRTELCILVANVGNKQGLVSICIDDEFTIKGAGAITDLDRNFVIDADANQTPSPLRPLILTTM